jgi:hypothetical protein
MKAKIAAVSLTLALFIGVVAAHSVSRRRALANLHVADQSIPGNPVENNSQSLIGERGPVRNIRFIVFDAGIHPNELRTTAGLVNIAIEDKTNTSEGLVIRQVVGNQRVDVGVIRRITNHWRGRSQFRLLPGTYEVYDASKPENTASLILVPDLPPSIDPISN